MANQSWAEYISKRAVGMYEALATLASGMNPDGSVFGLATSAGGYTDQISPTITVSTSTYAAGDVVGGVLTLVNAVRASGSTAVLQSLFLQDLSNQKPALDIFIYNANPTAGTYTDNGAFPINTTDLAKQIRRISIATSDWGTTGTIATADLSLGGKILKAVGSTNLYAVFVVGGSSTPTFATTTALTARFGVLQD